MFYSFQTFRRSTPSSVKWCLRNLSLCNYYTCILSIAKWIRSRLSAPPPPPHMKVLWFVCDVRTFEMTPKTYRTCHKTGKDVPISHQRPQSNRKCFFFSKHFSKYWFLSCKNLYSPGKWSGWGFCGCVGGCWSGGGSSCETAGGPSPDWHWKLLQKWQVYAFTVEKNFMPSYEVNRKIQFPSATLQYR